MLRTYHGKCFTTECLLHKKSVSIYHKGWQFSCHHITDRNVNDLSLKNISPQIVYCTKINVSLYHKGWQFSCHLITGRNVKDLSLGNVLPQIVYCTKISVRFVLQNTHNLRLLFCSLHN